MFASLMVQMAPLGTTTSLPGPVNVSVHTLLPAFTDGVELEFARADRGNRIARATANPNVRRLTRNPSCRRHASVAPPLVSPRAEFGMYAPDCTRPHTYRTSAASTHRPTCDPV